MNKYFESIVGDALKSPVARAAISRAETQFSDLIGLAQHWLLFQFDNNHRP